MKILSLLGKCGNFIDWYNGIEAVGKIKDEVDYIEEKILTVNDGLDTIQDCHDLLKTFFSGIE